jgi:hypothetical protein
VEGNNSAAEYTLGIDGTAATAVTAAIKLTVVDTKGRTASTQSFIIKDVAGNINFVGIATSSTVASKGLVNFTPLDNFANIAGTPIHSISPAYDSYEIDFDNNGVYDESNTTAEMFSNTYSTTASVVSGTNKIAKISITDSASSVALNDVFVEVSFEPLAKNQKDVIIENIDCTKLEVHSPTTNYINELVGFASIDNSTMNFLELSIDVNCCNSPKILKIPTTFNFELVNNNTCVATINTLNVGGFDYTVYQIPITISGIDPSFVKSVEYTRGANSDSTLVTNTNTNLLQIDDIEFLLDNPLFSGFPLIVENKQIIITTTEGFKYIINFTITPDNATATCIGTLVNITSVEYPDYPNGITISQDQLRGSYIEIDSSIYNDTNSTFLDGIYTVIISKNSNDSDTISGCKFIDCNTKCLVLKALINNCDPIISILYNSLLEIDKCNNVNCNSLCETYAYLESLLDECDCSMYSNTSLVYSHSNDCGCLK